MLPEESETRCSGALSIVGPRVLSLVSLATGVYTYMATSQNSMTPEPKMQWNDRQLHVIIDPEQAKATDVQPGQKNKRY